MLDSAKLSLSILTAIEPCILNKSGDRHGKSAQDPRFLYVDAAHSL